jgi:hypothetical protein
MNCRSLGFARDDKGESGFTFGFFSLSLSTLGVAKQSFEAVIHVLLNVAVEQG